MKRLLPWLCVLPFGLACVVSPPPRNRPCKDGQCDPGYACAAATNECVLQGVKGDKGDPGALGPQGPQGLQGAQGPQGPAGAGFRASFDFEEGTGTSTADGSGNNLGGALTGTGVVWETGGHSGNALRFDGSGTVTVADAPVLNPREEITLSAWVYPTAPGGTIVAKEGQYELALNGQQLQLTVTTVSGPVGTISGGNVATQTWSHVRGTYDGQALRLFVNGDLVAKLAHGGGRLAVTDNPLTVGRRASNANGIQARIDELRILGLAVPPVRPPPQVIYTIDPRDKCPNRSNAPGPVLTQNLTVPPGGGTAVVNARIASRTDDPGLRDVLLKVDGNIMQADPQQSTTAVQWMVHNFAWAGRLAPGAHQIQIVVNNAPIDTGCGFDPNGKMGSILTVLHPD